MVRVSSIHVKLDAVGGMLVRTFNITHTESLAQFVDEELAQVQTQGPRARTNVQHKPFP